MIKNIGSVFYFILLEEYCINIKEARTVKKELIGNFGVRPIKQLDPLGESDVQGSTSRHLIANQNRSFLNNMTLKYPTLVKNIQQNIFRWVSRISYACLR